MIQYDFYQYTFEIVIQWENNFIRLSFIQHMLMADYNYSDPENTMTFTE